MNSILEIIIGIGYMAVVKAVNQDYQPLSEYRIIKKKTEQEMVGQAETEEVSDEVINEVPPDVVESLNEELGQELATGILNIAGGIKVSDPAIDMAIISSVLSSNLDIPIGREICFAGETGLSGEIRPVSRIDQRIREASKMGFSKIYISKYHRNLSTNGLDIEVIPVAKIEALVRSLFS